MNRLLFLACLLLTCTPPPVNNTYIAEQEKILADTSLLALFVPIRKVTLSLSDYPVPATRQQDSFFVDVTNALAQYEISRHYKILHFDPADSGGAENTGCASSQPDAVWSLLASDAGSPEKLGAFVRSIAQKCSVDLVIFPYSCELRGSSFKPRGWRNDKYGKYYERPVSFTTEAVFHLQIWEKSGKLAFERKGKGYGSKPIFHSVLKKESMGSGIGGIDIKNLIAPPLIGALTNATTDAFVFR
jgi:hypothetical protein